MHTITFYPLGNADCYRIDLENGHSLLFDYANTRCPDDLADKRCDLPVELRRHLTTTGRGAYDVVAFTHLDNDHVCGASDFFYLEHAAKYQAGDRVRITEMWVPAFAITETRLDLCGDAQIIQAEARYRLRKGAGIRVFSRPEVLKGWLEACGLSLDSRRHLITDAGQVVPGWTKATHGVEFFVHSPFAHRHNDGTFVDRNTNSLVFQATFVDRGVETRAILAADSEHELLSQIVDITRLHGREERLRWDLVKLPHHCSYLSLGPEKGAERTQPVPNVSWLYEQQGGWLGRIVSPSDPVPRSGDSTQPPHRQAAAYYREILKSKGGEFLVTMEYPSATTPAPLRVLIDHNGLTVPKPDRVVGGGVIGGPAPRAG